LGFTVTLLIQKSAAKTVPLPIQKSALKNHVPAGSKIGSDGGVISRFTFFFVGSLHSPLII